MLIPRLSGPQVLRLAAKNPRQKRQHISIMGFPSESEKSLRFPFVCRETRPATDASCSTDIRPPETPNEVIIEEIKTKRSRLRVYFFSGTTSYPSKESFARAIRAADSKVKLPSAASLPLNAAWSNSNALMGLVLPRRRGAPEQLLLVCCTGSTIAPVPVCPGQRMPGGDSRIARPNGI